MDPTASLPAGATRLHEPARLASLLWPEVAKINRQFQKKLRRYGVPERRALTAVTPGAAAQVLHAGGSFTDFLEQVEYNGRRLAKLNVPPVEIERALRLYEGLVGRRFAGEPLHLAITLTLNRAFYQVREAETQAFYGLFHAELEARSLEDLLRRFIAILTRTFHAPKGRLWVFGPGRPEIAPRLLRRLSRPRYLKRDSAGDLILDPGMRGRFASYWSIPLSSAGRVAGLVQFGFPKEYRWLPRELQMLDAVAERCLQAAEKARLLESLAARESLVRELAERVLDVEEEERRRISRELHDETGQAMLTLRLQLEMLQKTVPEARARLGEARSLVESLILELRRLIGALSPAVLEQVGLPAAIRQLARGLQARDVRVRLQFDVNGQRLSREVETVAYRLAQESFQNVAKHAEASCVNLSLRTTDKQLELSIRDNGVGFDVGAANGRPNSFGLAGMRERVDLFGGTFRVVSRLGRGTQVSIALPLAASSRRKVAHGQDSSTAHRRSHPVSRRGEDID